MLNRADVNVSMDCDRTSFDLVPSEHKQTNLSLLISQHRNQWVIEFFSSSSPSNWYVVNLRLLILVMSKRIRHVFSFMKSSSKLHSIEIRIFIERDLLLTNVLFFDVSLRKKKKDQNQEWEKRKRARIDLVYMESIIIRVLRWFIGKYLHMRSIKTS